MKWTDGSKAENGEKNMDINDKCCLCFIAGIVVELIIAIIVHEFVN